MQRLRYLALPACLILVWTSFAQAQSLAKRHQLELQLGFWNQTSDVRSAVEVGGVTTSVKSSGALGGLSYGHWLREHLALTLSITGMAADVEARTGPVGVRAVTAVVAPLFVGVKYYLPASTYGSPTRPYARVAAGPVFGAQSSAILGSSFAVEERTEAALGGHLGGGVDFILGRHFMLGVAAGYHLMSDFNDPIGGSVNYSGPDFSIGIGLLLGAGQAPRAHEGVS